MIEQFFLPHFHKPESLVLSYFDVDALVSAVKFDGSCDDGFEFLRNGRPFSHGIDDFAE